MQVLQKVVLFLAICVSCGASDNSSNSTDYYLFDAETETSTITTTTTTTTTVPSTTTTATTTTAVTTTTTILTTTAITTTATTTTTTTTTTGTTPSPTGTTATVELTVTTTAAQTTAAMTTTGAGTTSSITSGLTTTVTDAETTGSTSSAGATAAVTSASTTAAGTSASATTSAETSASTTTVATSASTTAAQTTSQVATTSSEPPALTMTSTSTENSDLADAVVITGEIDIKVVGNARRFASSPAVKFAVTKSIAELLQCPEEWIVVTMQLVEERRVRRLQASGSVQVFYNVTIPAGEDDVGKQKKAEATALVMMAQLEGIQQDMTSFKSVVETELAAAKVEYSISELSVAAPVMTSSFDSPKMNLSLRASVGLAVIVTIWNLVC